MSKSHALFERAGRSIPGGVNSPVRAFRGVGGDPVFIARAEGAYLYDADGRRYIDMMSAYSAVSHGHCHPRLVNRCASGFTAGLPGLRAPTQLARPPGPTSDRWHNCSSG